MNGSADGDLKHKITEYQAREKVYLAGLLEQEAEMHRVRCMTSHVVGAYGDISHAALRGGLADCAVNMEVLLLRQKAREKDREISDLRDRLESNQFDQRSAAGQALMRKCRSLLEENHQLGEQVREDKVAQLHAVLRAEKQENSDLLQRCKELADFCKELNQENEKLQGTLSKVAAKLRETKAEKDGLQNEYREARAKRRREKEKAKTLPGGGDEHLPAEAAVMPKPGDGVVAPAAVAVAPVMLAPQEELAAAAAALPVGGAEPQEKEKEGKKRKRRKKAEADG